MYKYSVRPLYRGVDKGDGGIRRVVEAQLKHLPTYGFEYTDNLHEADIVSVHGGITANAECPVVSHCHGLYWKEYEWQRWALALNKEVINSMNRADAVTAPSEWVARTIERGMQIKPTVLYHGIDIDDWNPGTNGNYVLWNKTRVDSVCTPEPLDILASKLPDTKFVSTFGATQSNVQLTGKLPFAQAKSLIANAGLYLCTSRETFGIGTLEAMACGVPILGWNWGGQREIVKHKENGYLATPYDYDDLVEGYHYCVAHRPELGEYAREVVTNYFTWPIAIKRYADLYTDVIKAHEGPRPKISVIMRCFNLSHYLPMAVDSVLAQTYKDWELIIVDDCSTDDSGIIADRYAAEHSNIHVVHNPKNVYISEAYNVGIEVAKGKYILPVDADNMIPPRTMELLLSELERDPHANIVYGAMEVINPKGQSFVSDWPGKFDYNAQMGGRNQCPSTSLYLRDLWVRVGGYRQRCRTAEDADFWTRAISYGGRPKKVTDVVTLQYFLRDDSVSHVNKAWDWVAWYPWGKSLDKAPFGAPVEQPSVSSYEPLLVSVIIPVGPEHAKYLPDALDSLQAQSLDQWEVIIVNDSGEPLTRLPAYAKVCETAKAGSGPGAARNKGVQLANAPLLLFLDADDYLAPSALAQMVDAYKEYGGYIYSDFIHQEDKQYVTINMERPEDVLRRLPHPVTCLVPRSAFDAVHGFDTKLEAWEDWDFYIAINAAGWYGSRVAAPLLYYRMGAGARRESAYANKDAYKVAIYDKWHDYIEGVKKFMPCGGCGKKRAVQPPAVQQNQTVQAATVRTNDGEAVLLEFVPNGVAPMTYRGQVTGTLYRFGSDSGHRRKYVYTADVPYLLARKEFKRVSLTTEGTTDSILEAAVPTV